MIEYLPWSQKTFIEAVEKYKQGKFSILDIELGGMCNLKCVYCDSPDRSKRFTAQRDVHMLIESGVFSWLYICGLGEPTFAENKTELLRLLELCKQHHVKCSMFSNMTNFDDELFRYVEDGTLYVMFKLDSFDSNKISKLYGAGIDVNNLQRKIEKLIDMVHVEDNCTNVCASIVPTQENYSELPQIIEYCEKHNIFPLIGDLEDSGRGSNVFTSLKISDEDLKIIKDKFKDKYEIPICPSVLCGIHILYDGSVAVDAFSGLSCHWFWLAEPDVKCFGKIWDYSCTEDVEYEILQYRKERFEAVKERAVMTKPLVFGGCGGDIVSLLSIYTSIKIVEV